MEINGNMGRPKTQRAEEVLELRIVVRKEQAKKLRQYLDGLVTEFTYPTLNAAAFAVLYKAAITNKSLKPTT